MKSKGDIINNREKVRTLINEGALRGFSKRDYLGIKLINQTLNKAEKENDIRLEICALDFADKISKKGHKRLMMLCGCFSPGEPKLLKILKDVLKVEDTINSYIQ